MLLWIEKAEEKQNQREEDSDDVDKLKKQRKKLEVSDLSVHNSEFFSCSFSILRSPNLQCTSELCFV